MKQDSIMSMPFLKDHFYDIHVFWGGGFFCTFCVGNIKNNTFLMVSIALRPSASWRICNVRDFVVFLFIAF